MHICHVITCDLNIETDIGINYNVDLGKTTQCAIITPTSVPICCMPHDCLIMCVFISLCPIILQPNIEHGDIHSMNGD